VWLCGGGVSISLKKALSLSEPHGRGLCLKCWQAHLAASVVVRWRSLDLVFPAMAAVVSWFTSKACQRFLLLNAVTAKVRLTNNHLKPTPGFSYI
jgi:hypothetical protein